MEWGYERKKRGREGRAGRREVSKREREAKCICPNCEMYLPNLQNVFDKSDNILRGAKFRKEGEATGETKKRVKKQQLHQGGCWVRSNFFWSLFFCNLFYFCNTPLSFFLKVQYPYIINLKSSDITMLMPWSHTHISSFQTRGWDTVILLAQWPSGPPPQSRIWEHIDTPSLVWSSQPPTLHVPPWPTDY